MNLRSRLLRVALVLFAPMALHAATAEIKVKGMICSSCEQKVEQAVRLLNGVSRVKANHRSTKVEVTFDEHQVSRTEIVSTINALPDGFSAS